MIYLIITTSIHNKVGVMDTLHREQRYRESIHQLLTVIDNDPSIKPILVENNGFRSTYLDELCEVCYTNNNTLDFPHKGCNELLDLKEVIQRYNIQEDDMVIKLTGRYKLLDDHFITLVKNYKEYNAFVKFFNVCTLEYVFDDCVLGLFAIQCKYLTNFEYACIKSPECEFADHVRKQNHVMEVDQLHLECCFADDLRLLIV
jgi:hypothetical protein